MVLTVIETPTFQKQAAAIWSEDERFEFIEWISLNAEAGDVIPGTGGARKVRWSAQGKGKRGGARVIYVLVRNDGQVVLVAVYAKSVRSSMKASDIRRR